PTEIEAEQDFAGYGLDAVQLNRLKKIAEEHYDCNLSFTVFSGPASVNTVAQHIVSLTAKSEPKHQATPPSAPSLAGLAYTLQVGREAMDSRLALVVSSVEELIARLSRYLSEPPAIEGLYSGNIKTSTLKSELLLGGEAGAAFIQLVLRNRELDRLAQLWVSGVEIEWPLLYGSEKPRRVSLPAYPFAKKRYWFDTPLREERQQDRAIETISLQGNWVYPPQSAMPGTTGKQKVVLAHSSAPPVPRPESAVQDQTLIEQQLRQQLVDILRVDLSDIDDQEKFIDLGLDSITGVEWVKRINNDFRLDLSATRLYDYPTLQQLAGHLAQIMSQPVAEAVTYNAPVPLQLKRPTTIEEPRNFIELSEGHRATVQPHSTEAAGAGPYPAQNDIAVIGLAGRFPGANDVDEFWQNIAVGVDSIVEVGADRWDVMHYYDPDRQAPGKSYSKWLGTLADIDKFDPLFFNISPREAERMDPQQRLFLQEAWTALEDAGYAGHALSASKCGIFVGASAGDYQPSSPTSEADAHTLLGSSPSILAARLAYILNLKGASLAIDTACSSSLVAIHEGCQSLLTGQNDLVLAGGVCVLTGPQMHIMTSKAQMLAGDGRCKTFDQRADGFGIAEGVGVVVLKRLAE
ncbi:MAG: hypothetical protein KDJ52_34440, partial [Anaerolineae bacterium]|nr:hypothetical protein [Anaerolineae bacterium]